MLTNREYSILAEMPDSCTVLYGLYKENRVKTHWNDDQVAYVLKWRKSKVARARQTLEKADMYKVKVFTRGSERMYQVLIGRNEVREGSAQGERSEP